MNPQEKQQVAARDDKWVPLSERVKISSTNIRLETTVPQKEETFQVVIDLIKNSTCFKAFTISADVPEIFMTILDICPRVEGVDFTDVPDDDTALTFLIDLGYKGPLYKHTNIMITGKKRDQDEKTCHINHFLKQHKSLSNLNYQHYHTINDDGIVSRLKFVKIGQIPLKKSRGKGSKGKKTVDNSQETVDVSEESEPEPELTRKKTSSKRRVKNKVTLSADDNIISDDPNAALEIVTESVPESAKKKSSGRSSKSVVIQDTPSALKAKPATSKTKLKDAPSLTLEEQEATDIVQVLKESKKDKQKTTSEGTGIKPGVPDEEKDITEEKVILEWGDEQDSEYSDDDNDDVEKDDKDGDADDEGNNHISDTQDADYEDAKTKSDGDDIYKYKIRVRKDEDEEMLNVKVDDSDKDDEGITDAAKADAKKTSEVKDDPKKTELPPSSSRLSINSLLEVKIQSEVPHTQSPSALSVPVSVIFEPTVLTPVQESPSIATATTLPPPFVSTTPSVLQQTTTLIPTPPTTTDAQIITTAVSESNAPSAIELRQFPESSKKQTPTIDLEQGSKKSASEILQIKREQAEKQQTPKFTIKSINKAALEEYDMKNALYQSMHENKSFNRNPANH
ncbi:hypothetical protein Tco_1267807 [Tanacetum coccineum]